MSRFRMDYEPRAAVIAHDGGFDFGRTAGHPRTPTRDSAETDAVDRLDRALSALASRNRALALSQKELEAAHAQCDELIETVIVMTQKLIDLEAEAARTRHLAYHDPLTGLPNRSLLLNRLDQAMAQRQRNGKRVAILLIDLDDFKMVNDRYGHQAGDELLLHVATCLSACIRGGDTACRYGGDEFVIMLPEIEDRSDADAVAEKVRIRLDRPYVFNDQEIEVTASIGLAVSRFTEQEPVELIGQADAAMYRAKAQNKTAETAEPAG